MEENILKASAISINGNISLIDIDLFAMASNLMTAEG